jgi:hypothetical protein
MDFGPSVFFLVSCVTGRVDGIRPDNSLALAYQHGGTNVYIGATRSTVGWLTQGSDNDMRLDAEGAVLLAEYYTEDIVADKDVGIALRDAKNAFLIEDSTGGNIDAEWAFIVYAHYILHGDPAFNPYEPANGG